MAGSPEPWGKSRLGKGNRGGGGLVENVVYILHANNCGKISS